MQQYVGSKWKGITRCVKHATYLLYRLTYLCSVRLSERKSTEPSP